MTQAPATKPVALDRAWQQATAWFAAHRDPLLILAGVFLFLPAFAQALFVPPPPLTGLGQNDIDALAQYVSANGHWLFLLGLPTLIGSLAITRLALDRGGTAIGEILGAAVRLLPTAFFVNVLMQLSVFGGLLLFLVPGLYLLGRVSLAFPALVSRASLNPMDALSDSWNLSRGNGWRLALLVLVVFLVATVVTLALTSTVGILAALVVRGETLETAMALLRGLTTAATQLAMLLALAGAWRQLTEPA